MTEITVQDWSDWCYIQQLIARGESDFRYVIEKNPEPDDPSTLYYVDKFDWVTGERVESFTTDDPYAAIEAAREVQEIPDIETRWNMQAEREHNERMGY